MLYLFYIAFNLLIYRIIDVFYLRNLLSFAFQMIIFINFVYFIQNYIYDLLQRHICTVYLKRIVCLLQRRKLSVHIVEVSVSHVGKNLFVRHFLTFGFEFFKSSFCSLRIFRRKIKLIFCVRQNITRNIPSVQYYVGRLRNFSLHIYQE